MPLAYNPDASGAIQPIEIEKYAEMESRLTAQFGAYTASNRNTPFLGRWSDPQTGQIYHDQILVYTILDFGSDLDSNEQFLWEFREFLKEFLEQEEILIKFHEEYVLS